ncbi:MAG: hypothetical protein HY819_09020 [Acidobacteria bacterium]|nr:hypothetical protein [Acidobacteriota bacterium]
MNRLKQIILAVFIIFSFLFVFSNEPTITAQQSVTEALTGFDDQSNGFTDASTHRENLDAFAETEGIKDGVGPVFNSFSCGECHSNPVIGGSSQITELRAGHFDGQKFIDHPGGSLIQSRAIDPSIVEKVLDGNEVRTLRLSLSILGDGYIEAIDDSVLLDIAKQQPNLSGGKINGQALWVPVEEAPGVMRIGRFGWKSQQASLLSFSGDAYTNEMGITTPLFPIENTSNGKSISKFDPLPDPDEGDNDDIEIFTEFMRATKAPSRDMQLARTSSAQAGEGLFNNMGCVICHVSTFKTLPAAFKINGGTFTIPPAIGDKIIHPYSDFLLHDIGTGDGIVQNAGQETRNKIRTVPLWGLRTRNRFMHDGLSLTVNEAILRHAGEASFVIDKYRALSKKQKQQVLTFLSSL